MDTTYENRYVAFLDILGFKNMVLQSENNQQILNLINMALKTLLLKKLNKLTILF